MESMFDTTTTKFGKTACGGNIGSTGNLIRMSGGGGVPQREEQRRGSTPMLNVSISGHKKLCRVARGQRVILGSTQPVFVTELRPAISTELLSLSQSSLATKTSTTRRSPLNIEVDGGRTPMPAPTSPLTSILPHHLTAVHNSKSCDTTTTQHSDLFYSASSSGDDHSSLSRNSTNTSEASETLSQEYSSSYSPIAALTTTTMAPSADSGVRTTTTAGAADDVDAAHSPANTTVSSQNSGEFVSDFSKLSLQDSGYSGSFPLCATNSDASSTAVVISPPLAPPQPDTTTDADAGTDDYYYASLLDFTLKLGYNEVQLKSVLVKLGTNTPGQDKVLAELIKLGQDVQEVMAATSNATAGANHHHQEFIVISPNSRHQGGSPTTTVTAANSAVGAASPQQHQQQQCGLRAIVVDGSNVAMTHGNKVVFSCLGIRLCVDWFRRRGHTDIKVFVPQFRKEQSRSDNPITDQHVLFDLEKENMLVWTPSRRLGGRRIICHDDRYILKTAVDKNAVIVSNDEYRDMMYENPDFRKAVEERLLMYNFIDGKFVVPDDPLGRYGPKLDQFLSKSSPNSSAPPCPYGRKCTYGNKCKFFHPERPGGLHRSVTERLRDHAEMHRRVSPTTSLQLGRSPDNAASEGCGGFSPPNKAGGGGGQRQAACRTQSLNPASLLRQNSSSNASTPPPVSRYSPPSSATSASPPYHHFHLMGRQSSIDPAVLSNGCGDEWKYQQRLTRTQRLRAESSGHHSALSKQLSNPEAVTMNNHHNHHHLHQHHYGGGPIAGGGGGDDRRYLMLPTSATTMVPSPPPPNSILRQIWQNEQQQHHQPVVRNMSAPGVNLLKQHQHQHYNHNAQFTYVSAPTRHNAPPPPLPPSVCGNNSYFYSYDYHRKNSVSDSQLNLLGNNANATAMIVAAAGQCDGINDDAFFPPGGGSNYYIPSTTVWGPVEHSSSPIFTTSPSNAGDGWPAAYSAASASSTPSAAGAAGAENNSPSPPPPALETGRAKVRYHLSQLFCDDLVNSIMTAHPNETDPQKLCALILEVRERAAGGGNENNSSKATAR